MKDFVFGALLLAACGGDTFVVVTVQTRPAVHGATSLSIELATASSSRTDTLSLAGHDFPVTFAIDAAGKSGDLTITVDAVDDSMTTVGRGVTTTTLDHATAQVTLDSADFVVNTDFAGDQELSTDPDANGVQLGADGSGNWSVAFRGACDGPCDMLARRFDSDGVPLTSAAAAGTNQFAMTTSQVDFSSTPAMTGSGVVTMGFWDFESADFTTSGVQCQRLDATGAELATAATIATDADTDVVSAAPIGTGNFAVVWSSVATTEIVRAAVVNSACTTIGSSLVTVSGTADASRANVAANGSNLLYAWTESGDVHVRPANQVNTLGTQVTFLTAHATEDIEYVRVAKMGDGFAVVVRWASTQNQTDPGRIELYLADATGLPLGPPTIVTGKAGSDFASALSFGVASRDADGATLVVWHACGDNGDGQGCGVFGRIIRPTGVPVGDPFVLATTTVGDQTNPSAVGLAGSFAVAWNDASQSAPDVSGLAVRARVVFPAYDDAHSVLGAPCSDSDPCGDNLTCVAGSDGTPRCYQNCDPTQAPPLCPDGGTCADGACQF